MTGFTGAEIQELAATVHKRVNVGCGQYAMGYWTNLDSDPDVAAAVHAVVPPMPFDDGALDHIWACHFLEHLDYDTGQEFLKECYRCLEPGGRLGIVVPDTREIMRRWYNQTGDAVQYPEYTWWDTNDLDNICHLFLYSTIQDSPHRWSYDQDTLARAMAQAGFVQFKLIDKYRDPRLACGAWYQVGLDGYKPEGTKEDGEVQTTNDQE